MLTHVVLLRFTDPADATEAKARLEALVGQVPAIRSLDVALATSSPTGHQLALRTTHDDEAGLRAYAEHPAHVAVSEWMKPRLSDRAVVDSLAADEPASTD